MLLDPLLAPRQVAHLQPRLLERTARRPSKHENPSAASPAARCEGDCANSCRTSSWHWSADDLIERFLTFEVDGHRLGDDDIVNLMHRFVIAGLETATSSLTCIEPTHRLRQWLPPLCRFAPGAAGVGHGAAVVGNGAVFSGGEPSHSIVGSAADVALFFQALVHSGLWAPGIVEEATTPRVSQPPFGEQLYGGSPEVANIGLSCSVSGDYGGSRTPRTGSPRTLHQLRDRLRISYVQVFAGPRSTDLTGIAEVVATLAGS